ncbi:MAG: protein rep [Melioribacteraceae bacterium]|nr:protein rep [Melioribacteraceae bacterium]
MKEFESELKTNEDHKIFKFLKEHKFLKDIRDIKKLKLFNDQLEKDDFDTFEEGNKGTKIKKGLKLIKYIRKMTRQIMCGSHIEVYDNGVVRSRFCGQKTCLVCNSIRLAKFLDRYLPALMAEPFKYHMVLTVKNPGDDDLEEEINRMYKFFNQSSIKRNERYKELNKKIRFIRSFETTFNVEKHTYHIHFHILLSGDNEEEIKEYGALLIDYWLKYFGEKAHRSAQHFEPQRKSVVENFKYLFKLKDVNKSNMRMVFNLLKATDGKRLFTAKNFKKDEVKKNEEEIKSVLGNGLEKEFFYDTRLRNWVDVETGEIFIDDIKEKAYENDIDEAKNLVELKGFFRSVKL